MPKASALKRLDLVRVPGIIRTAATALVVLPNCSTRREAGRRFDDQREQAAL